VTCKLLAVIDNFGIILIIFVFRKECDFMSFLNYLSSYISIGNLSELSSPSIIRMITSRRMRLAGHVAQLGEKRNA
jgi:hypothetical protein